MASFLAHVHGYAEARKKAEREHAERESVKSQRAHPGGAIVELFPDGVIRI